MNRVAIVIPAYNEEKRIGKTLDAYSDFFEKLRKKKEIDYEILVVINNTRDRTPEIVRGKQKKNKRIGFLDLERGGKGYAVIEGFKDALKRKNDFIGFVDADMATPPEEYWKLIRVLQNKKIDGVIASRYVKGAVVKPKPTVQRLVAKKAFNFVVRTLLLMPFNDTQCGAKVFMKDSVDRIIKNSTMSQWAFDVEMLYNLKKDKKRIFEFPTIWEDKEYSKINFWKAGPRMVFGVIRLRLLNSPFKNMVRIYDKMLNKYFKII